MIFIFSEISILLNKSKYIRFCDIPFLRYTLSKIPLFRLSFFRKGRYTSSLLLSFHAIFIFFKIPISRNGSSTISIGIPFLRYTLSNISLFRLSFFCNGKYTSSLLPSFHAIFIFFFKIPISRNRSFTISIDIPFLCYTLSKISFFRKNRYTYDIREIL